MNKLRNHPKTRDLFSDPSYAPLIQELQTNPGAMATKLADPRVLTTLSVLLGVDLEAATEGFLQKKFEFLFWREILKMNSYKGDEAMETEPPPATIPDAKEEKKRREEEERKRQEQAKYDALPDNKKAALAEKEKGNAAYKKKHFQVALDHYNAAFELDPTDMTYLTNSAAVEFEQKDYAKSIELCQKAIEIGRENRADFKIIAKAFTRIGNSYKKLKVFHYFFFFFLIFFGFWIFRNLKFFLFFFFWNLIFFLFFGFFNFSKFELFEIWIFSFFFFFEIWFFFRGFWIFSKFEFFQNLNFFFFFSKFKFFLIENCWLIKGLRQCQTVFWEIAVGIPFGRHENAPVRSRIAFERGATSRLHQSRNCRTGKRKGQRIIPQRYESNNRLKKKKIRKKFRKN